MGDFRPPYNSPGEPNPLPLGCPHCGHEALYGRVLRDLGVVRCNQCSGTYAPDGSVLTSELTAAIHAMDQVVHGREVATGMLSRILLGAGYSKTQQYIDGISTASERAHWLREMFRENGLDPHTAIFVATRRQLARCFGQVEPEVAAPQSGYRGEARTRVRTYEGEVERLGVLGSNMLEVGVSVIRCGRAKVERERAIFFRIVRVMRGDPPQTVAYRLLCVRDDLRPTVLMVIGPDRLGELSDAVIGMETAMGWLLRRARA